MAFQRDSSNGLVCSQLLLQVNKLQEKNFASSKEFLKKIIIFQFRCGNVAAILELNEHLQRDFTIFEAAPQESRGIPSKKPQADYFL